MRYFAATGVVLATLLLPSSAVAVDRYVDQDTGDNTANDCTNPAAPCDNIFTGLDQAANGENVFVDDSPTAYAENVTITQAERLVAQEFVGGDENLVLPEPDTIIEPTSGEPVMVSNTSGAVVNGFRIRGNGPSGTQSAIGATFSDNTFDDSDPPIQVLSIQGGPTTIDGNTFTDSGTTDNDHAVDVFAGPVMITDNTISGYRQAITLLAGGEISRNTITGVHPFNITPGIGINIQNVTATVTGNHFHSTEAGSTTAVAFGSGPAGASFQRNRIFDHDIGVAIGDTTQPITFQSDVIANNSTLGIDAQDFTAGTAADFSMTNATVFDNGTDIRLSDNNADATPMATLNSTIVEDAINKTSSNPTCALQLSAGPTTTGDSCEAFQFSNANPMFVNPAGDDYHLQSGSPLIDMGDPASPGGAQDVDGDPRAVAVTGCPPRRDIGADEFVPASPLDCTPPTSSSTGGGQAQPQPEPQAAPDGAPDTNITAGPSGRTKQRSATIEFNGSDARAVVRFECKLDDGAFETCTSPKTYTGLKKGDHTVQVRAIDDAGNVDPTPATRSWKVKKKRKRGNN